MYLALNSQRLVELSDGCLEFPPMPTLSHQLIVLYIFEVLNLLVRAQGLGKVLVAPLPVHLGPGKYREPAIVFLRHDRLRAQPEYPEGADLVMEVVSGGPADRKRDLIVKRAEYAQAGIPEYWIVDPEARSITVLVLIDHAYQEHGIFKAGGRAASRVLPGFSLDVEATFRAGSEPAGASAVGAGR